MNISDYKAGTWRKGYQYQYFLPEKINHSFVWTDEGINELLEKASLRLGELNSFSRFVPDPNMFIKMHIVPKDALQVKVTSQKWFWTFDYTVEGVNSLNELVVPVGKPVQLTMSSKDVIHSFYVPGFRIKMDVLPNRYTVTWFEATRKGEFELFCAEYCGTGHSEMIGKVRVVSEREFKDWIGAGSAVDEGLSLVDLGAKLYTAKACITCHSIDGAPGIAPSFKGRFGIQIQLEGGKQTISDENYLRESILKPMAKIAYGFQPVMPAYQGILKDREIDALVEYIKSLQK